MKLKRSIIIKIDPSRDPYISFKADRFTWLNLISETLTKSKTLAYLISLEYNFVGLKLCEIINEYLEQDLSIHIVFYQSFSKITLSIIFTHHSNFRRESLNVMEKVRFLPVEKFLLN